MADVMQQLRDLYRLATGDANENEARTAAYLLLRKARANGVTIVFRREGVETPADAKAPASAPARAPAPNEHRCRTCGDTLFAYSSREGQCARCRWREAEAQREAEARRPRPPRVCAVCRGPLENERFERCAACFDERWNKHDRAGTTAAPRSPETSPFDVRSDYETFLHDFFPQVRPSRRK